MRIILDTHYYLAVEQILEGSDLLYTEPDQATSKKSFVLVTSTDVQYRDWASWCAAALDCGLVYGVRIERE